MPMLSVYMVTLNEEKRLPQTLRALSGVADEIILVDSGSEDNTVEIARGFGAKVYFREWDNYSAQKSYAESLCHGDWLMNIDADEEITEELGRELRDAIQNGKADVFRMHIADVFPGQKRPNRWVRHYNVIRLYRRGSASMGNTFTCDRVQLAGPGVRVGQLQGLVIHRSFVSLHQTVNKYNNYSDQQIETALAEGKNYSPWRIVLAMTANFFKYFILHRQFLYGFWGYINAVNLAYARFLKFAKYYENGCARKGMEPTPPQESAEIPE